MFDFILHHLAQISQTFQLLAALLAIAHWVRQLRKNLGLTQEQFAELLEVQPRTVQRWEKGDRKPRQEYMVKMQQIILDERRFHQGAIITFDGNIFTAESHRYEEVRKILEERRGPVEIHYEGVRKIVKKHRG